MTTTFLRGLSIKQKLTMVMLATIIAGVVLIGIFFMSYERIQMNEQLAHEVSTVSKVARAQLKVALIFDDVFTLQETANSLDFDETVDVVCIYDGDLNLKARSFPGSATSSSCMDNPYDVQAGFVDGNHFYIEDIYSEDAKIGTLLIRSNLSYVNSQIQRYSYMMLTALAIVTSVSLGVAVVLQKAVTGPIYSLADTASSIAENRDFTVRATKVSDDEVGMMVDAFNSMLEAIEQRNNELKANKMELESKVEERTSELQAANQELEAFSYSVSHDLRSPLRAIDGFSQALLEDCSEQLDSVGRGYLERVRLASQRMGVLIDSMLRLSRVTRQEISLARADLSAVSDEIVTELRERNAPREIDINIQPNMSAMCDARLIRIVLTNLIDNAWKYTRNQTAPVIEVGFERGVFFVRDNGAGFDMRYADKLFGAFQRLHSKEEFEGTGVGLATVARVIRRHNGDIWADSKVNQGATFYFTLPG
ncbi:MAG: ATP-binding protein [Pseudomonadales bacterium]|nr:ATP-binding protein [Pseudomonadales bacterium]